jgi:hypothetical protein
MEYRSYWLVRHYMPDDRLATLALNEEGGRIRMTFAFRFGLIHPALVRAFATFSNSFEDAHILDFDWSYGTQHPEFQAWFTRVDEAHTGGEPVEAFVGGKDSIFAEMLTHKDLIDPAVIRELNEEVMPSVSGLLVPRHLVDHDPD